MDWKEVEAALQERREKEKNDMVLRVQRAIVESDSFCLLVDKEPPKELLDNASRTLNKKVFFQRNPDYLRESPHYTSDGNEYGVDTDYRFGWIKTE